MQKASWVSDDDVAPTELPLAKAAEKVLASMHEVLKKTKEKRDEEWNKFQNRVAGAGEDDEKTIRVVKAKAAEVRLVRNLGSLKHPDVTLFKAEEV